MKRITILILLLLSGRLIAQDILIKDFDMDGIMDSVYLEEIRENDDIKERIVCRLSGQHFKNTYSGLIKPFSKMSSGIILTDDGFKYVNQAMRCGYENWFKYNHNRQQIELTGIGDFSFGNAGGDGSGEGYLDVQSGQYTGNWSYCDLENDSLIIMPAIQIKMNFPQIFLEDFSEEIYLYFNTKRVELFYRQREMMGYKDDVFYYTIPNNKLDAADTIRLKFIPIREKQFWDHKKKNASGNYLVSDVISEDSRSFCLMARGEHIGFKKYDNFTYSYYLGPAYEIRSHIVISFERETSTGYLLDIQTGDMIILPSPFDSGLEGVSIHSDSHQILFFVSNPHYHPVYSLGKALIHFCTFKPDEGAKSFSNIKVAAINDFYIEEVFWINEHSAVLKTYTWIGHEREYKYYETKIKE